MKKLFCLFGIFAAVIVFAQTKESGESVIVVYNSRMPESKEVAHYFVSRRNVPTNQIVGFDLPTTETMSRADYETLLEKPLLKFLESKKLFSFKPDLEAKNAGL